MRFSDQLDAWRNGSVVAPVHVRIKPINRCNHNCWYCAYRFKNLKLGEDINLSDVLPKNKLFEIIDDLVDIILCISSSILGKSSDDIDSLKRTS